MARAAGFFVVDTIGPHLDVIVAGAAGAAFASMEAAAEEVQYYARANAPWADQTGMARAGLNTSVFEEDGDIVLELAHEVDYGIWLELKNDGQYAIIMPTLEALGPKILLASGGSLVAVEEIYE